nr:RNA-directed DNA polymerase, eukaryota, nucleotide-binding alpha-beta plait domain protein [Tanacetum cinerariifolium]
MKILRYSRFSNADRVQNISHSIYVTNFPDSATSRDLWNACSVYPIRSFISPTLIQHGYKTGSYVNVVNNSYSVPQGPVLSSAPALVLDDECLIDRDLSKIGKLWGETLILENDIDNSFR